MQNKNQALVKKILNSFEESKRKSNYSTAENQIKQALKYEPNNISYINELALLLLRLNRPHEALSFWLKALEIQENNVIYCNVGNLYSSLGKFSEAIYYLEKSIALDPNYLPAHINLGSVWHHLGESQRVVEITIKAIGRWPKCAELHVNLGAALTSMNLLDEAIISIETALLLKPNFIEAKLSMAPVETLRGNNSVALKIYEDFIHDKKYLNHNLMPWAKYYLSYEYFKQGRLREAWEYYANGFDKSIAYKIKRRPDRQFNLPKWKGENLTLKKLLVWAEQGVGDEIIYMSIVDTLIKRNSSSSIIVECDSRLIPIFSRTYPSVLFRVPSHDANNYNFGLIEDFDYHIPMADLGGIYRNNIEDFYIDTYKLKVDKEKSDKYLNRLNLNNRRLKIGICWRSGTMDPNRNKHYTALIDWKDILNIKNATFINLQYGECENEIREVENLHGVEIQRWGDLDLKMDLDDVFALMSGLDLIVTAGTAVFAMGGALNIPVCMYEPEYGFDSLGTTEFPFLPSVKVFTPQKGSPIATCFPDIINFIETHRHALNKKGA